MANEKKTDLWVYDLLKEAEIILEPNGSSILEIQEALKTASKRKTGKSGFPEYIGTVKDYLLVIEDKAELSKHIKRDEKGVLGTDVSSITDYAVNGALFYAQHLAHNTSYKKIIAFGISGTEKHHRISPVYVDNTEYYRELPDVESFISFSEENIDEYYVREILKESTETEKETAEILKDAAALHEDLRNYGSLKDIDKPLVVSAILLALREKEFKNFSIENLTGDTEITDGQKIWNAVSANLQRSKVSPDVKKDKLLNQFSIVKDSTILNEINPRLGKTPLRHYTEFLDKKLYNNIRYTRSAEDYLGRFYGEFMSYSGGDGQTLGIVLTPKHITELFCDLIDLKPDDVVLDPTCGTAGFLIAAMHNMLKLATSETQKKNIRQKQLHGFELSSYMFTVATTNMILRGDGKSNLINDDFLRQDTGKLQLKGATVGMMNPPYSQGSKQNPDLYEISFTEHLLDSLAVGGRCAIIVPQSTMTGKTKDEKEIKENILKHHTLEGVITLNKDTFYGVGVHPVIAIFTAGEPHPADKKCKFINFENDGFRVAPHIGLIETESAKDKKQHLLDVWFDKIEVDTKFCVETTIEATDEWLHSFFYFNDKIPTDTNFDKTISDFLSFEFSMIMQNRGYLFDNSDDIYMEYKEIKGLEEIEWKNFSIGNLFTLKKGNCKNATLLTEGRIPYVGATNRNNGVMKFCDPQEIKLIKGNCIAFIGAGDGSAGYSIYKSEDFICSTSIICGYNEHLNKYNGLFISACSDMNESKYSHGHSRNELRLKRDQIMLPITSDGEPDYEYMEQYIKNKMYFKYIIYLIRCNIKKNHQKPLHSFGDGWDIISSTPILSKELTEDEYSHEISLMHYMSLHYETITHTLTIKIDFLLPQEEIKFYIKNIMSPEIAKAINEKAIRCNFINSNSLEMNKNFDKYQERTNFVHSILKDFKVKIGDNPDDIWVENKIENTGNFPIS